MSKAARPLNPRRIAVLAGSTFTQLVRMKVFYFMGIATVILLAANFLDLPTLSAPEAQGVGVLYSVKSSAFGLMALFSLVLGIVATALLLPRDVEDRTLYTILAKPVPRLDYLLGKLIGVCALILVSLIVLDLLMLGVLHYRTNVVLSQQEELAKMAGYSPEETTQMLQETRLLGPTWSLQGGVLALFCRAMVMASVAMLLSTFSTSTLFTAITGFLVLFIGFFQADARDYYFDGNGFLSRGGAAIMSIILPDLQIYNIADAVMEGRVLEAIDLVRVVAITLFYFVLYTFCSWLIFARKEF